MSDNKRPTDSNAVVARMDVSSADALIQSLAAEFARVHTASAAIEARLAAMPALSAKADRILAASEAENTEYPRSLVVDADAAFAGASGFHDLEYDSLGLPYRWTGPDPKFSFEAYVERSASARFALSFDDFLVPGPKDELRGFVDGAPAPLKVERRGDLHVAFGILPARAERGPTTITFDCPQMGRLQEPGRAEKREVGLRFRALTIEPAAE